MGRKRDPDYARRRASSLHDSYSSRPTPATIARSAMLKTYQSNSPMEQEEIGDRAINHPIQRIPQCPADDQANRRCRQRPLGAGEPYPQRK